MTKRFLAVLLALTALFSLWLCAYADGPDAGADPSTENILVIKNLNSGNNLILNSAPSRFFQAGVAAKLMTALLAYEKIGELDTKISVPFCAGDEKLRGSTSYMGFKYAENDAPMTLEDLLNAALLSCASDACLTLAVAAVRFSAGEATDLSGNHDAAYAASAKELGYLAEFTRLMNERARELGCTGTVFTNCAGVSDAASRTTAEDIAQIAAAVRGHTALFELSDQASYSFSGSKQQVFTKNALKSSYTLKGYTLDNARGMIAGFLQMDNYCVVTAAESDGLFYIFVAVSATADPGERYSAEDSAYTTVHTFLPWALSSFYYKAVLSPLTAVATVSVKAGANRDRVTIIARDTVELLLTKDIDEETDISVVYPEFTELTAPVAEGQEVGVAYVYLKGVLVGQSALVTNDGVAESAALSAFEKVKDVMTSSLMKRIYKWGLVILAAYVLLNIVLFFYRLVRKYIEAGKD